MEQYENISRPQKASPFAESDYITPFDDVQPDAAPIPEPEKKKKGGAGKRILSALLVIALVIGSCAVTALVVDRRWQQKTAVADQAMHNRLAVLQQQIADLKATGSGGATITPEGLMTPGQVYAANVNAVVAISNQALSTNIYGQVSKTASSGSGFIISSDGYVVSNYHVVEGATSLIVITADGTEYDAKLVGYEESNDVAVLKIEATDLPFVTLGSSDTMAVGDQVAAIGNPLGELTSTLTVGYISAKDRLISTDGTQLNMLQTDAAINSGNSGGPLFNMQGQVVGITTAKYSGTSGSGATIEGIGFAIPLDDVIGIIEDLRDHGYVTGSYLGVMVLDVDETAQYYGVPAGAYVDSVTAGGAAEKAGIRAKDIIINVGGYDVKSLADLSRVLRRIEPGVETTVTVYRSGQQVHLTIVPDEKAPEVQQTAPQQSQTSQDPFDYFFPFG